MAASTALAALAIDVHGLTKRYGGRAVVDNFSIRVERGEIFGFLGPNGSGKTTTIRMLCGLLTPDDGEGTCLGYDMRRDAAAIKREVGYMTQRFSLYEDLSIRGEPRLRRADVRRRRAQADDRTHARPARPRRRDGAARRNAVGRMEAAVGAGRVHAALTASCCCSTSRPPAWIRKRAATSGRRSTSSPPKGITVLVSTHYMDEAERCHRLAYITSASCSSKARPTKSSPARVCRRGASRCDGRRRACAGAARARARRRHGVDTVIPFGTTLRVSGRDAATLDAALAPARSSGMFEVTRTATTLEDVFVNLMQNATADAR